MNILNLQNSPKVWKNSENLVNIFLFGNRPNKYSRSNSFQSIYNKSKGWKTYYSSFTKNITESHLNQFRYYYSDNSFQVDATTMDGAPVEDGEYLLFWTDKNQKQHYVRLITYNH